MEASIERVIEYIERYSAAGDRLAARLADLRTWNAEDIERLRSGVPISESTRVTGSAERSRSLTRLLDEFESSRRGIRAAVVAAAVEEGMTITQIAEIFGVSRQLANRLVKEARALFDDPGTPARPG